MCVCTPSPLVSMSPLVPLLSLEAAVAAFAKVRVSGPTLILLASVVRYPPPPRPSPHPLRLVLLVSIKSTT